MNYYYRLGLFLLMIVCGWSSLVEARVQITTIPYNHGEVALEGVVAWDDGIKGKRPGILVVHEWWGLNEYVRERAEQLAALGYVAVAVDMYGKGKVTTHPDDARQWMQQITANVEMWQARGREGLGLLQANPLVDQTRLAAIGYCFGGATVMQMVYDGAPVKGVVSFHGSLPLPSASLSNKNSVKILIAHGEADPFLSQDHITKFKRALGEAGFDWHMVVFGGAQHGFTNPLANQYGMEGVQYQEQANRRSWGYMKLFFDEIFR
ncbi:MAG TPA: dienelactone hydrolase family protein [Nitrospirales bacterium]|nr:dienelactone hydrolase family protein [Nitrospirales bacterium]